MKKVKLTIQSDDVFTLKDPSLPLTHYQIECYFQENIKILNVLNSLETTSFEFKQLIKNFTTIYKIRYEDNNETSLRIGGTTYIELLVL